MSKFTDLLADPYAKKVYLVRVKPFNPFDRAIETFYFSDHGFVTEPGDTPPNTHWPARIISPIRIEKALTNSSLLRGFAAPDVGDIVISSGHDGDGNTLDDLILYYWDGYDVEIFMGGTDFAFSEFGTLFTGKTDGISYGLETLSISIKDPKAAFEINIQENDFSGTGGLEGQSDLEGSPKPISYGALINIEPVYLGSVDLGEGPLETFSFHDTDNFGSVSSVVDVYSNGVSLDEETGSGVDPGEFKKFLSDGVFQIGGSSGDTIITADIGGATGSSFEGNAAEIIEDLVTRLTSVTFASGTVSNATTKQQNRGLDQGYFLKNDEKLINAISENLESVNAYMTFNGDGEAVLGFIEEPSSTPDKTFDVSEITNAEIIQSAPPAWKVKLGIANRYRVHSFNEVASSLNDGQKTAFQTKQFFKSSSDTAIRDDNNKSQIEVFRSLITYTDLGSAQGEADRLLDLFKKDRRIYEVTVGTKGYDVQIGDTVEIDFPRLKMDAGENFVVIGIVIDGESGSCTLRLWGGAPFVSIQTEDESAFLIAENGDRLILE